MNKIRKELLIGIIYIILVGIFANMVHSVTPLLIKTLGIKDFWFGVFFACMSFASLIFSPIWGSVSDAKNRKIPLVIGPIIYGLGQFGFSYFKNPLIICVFRFVSGMGAAGMFGTFYAYISDYIEEKDRTKTLSMIVALQSIATAIGYLLGGVIGDSNYLLTFYLQVAGILLTAVFGFVFLKSNDSNKEENRIQLSNLFDIKAYKNILLGTTGFLFVFLFIECFSYNSYNSAISYFISTILLIDPSGIGFYMAAIGLFGLFMNVVIIPKLRKSLNDIGLAIVSSIFAAGFLLIAVITTNIVIASLVMMILYASTRIIFKPIFTSFILKKERNIGKSLGLLASMESLGGVFGSLVAGFVFELNPLLPFIISIGLLLLLFVGLIKSKKTVDRW